MYAQRSLLNGNEKVSKSNPINEKTEEKKESQGWKVVSQLWLRETTFKRGWWKKDGRTNEWMNRYAHRFN